MVQLQISANSNDILQRTELTPHRSNRRNNSPTYLDRRHDTIDLLLIQTQHPIQDGYLIVPQRFLPLSVELQESLELGFLVVVTTVVGP